MDIWKIQTQYLWVSLLALHWRCQKKLRCMEKHPYLFPIDAERSSSYWLVFNVMHLISLSTLWFMTANGESVKPAFWWVGNRLEYLDSFQVQSQPVLLDIKKTSENALPYTHCSKSTNYSGTIFICFNDLNVLFHFILTKILK